jgi:SAM-dependent methyltransferase/uncharacterized coiled-coil protein SlyX
MSPEEFLRQVDAARALIEPVATDVHDALSVPPTPASAPVPADIARPVLTPRSPMPAPGRVAYTLPELCQFDGTEFVEVAFVCLAGRLPDEAERRDFIAMVMRGETKPWVLGEIIRRLGTRPLGAVRGLRMRYAVQRLYRLPLIGSGIRWLGNLARLPEALRYQRMVEQQMRAEIASAWKAAATLERRASGTTAEALAHWDRRAEELRAEVRSSVDTVATLSAGVRASATLLDQFTHRLDALTRRLDDTSGCTDALRATAEASTKRADSLDAALRVVAESVSSLASRVEARDKAIEALSARTATIGAELEALSTRTATIGPELEALRSATASLHLRIDALAGTVEQRVGHRPTTDTMEDPADDFLGKATEASRRIGFGIGGYARDDVRYHLFEAAFYESTYVGQKQRAYLRYLDRQLCTAYPVLDIGCGRGEFLGILRVEGIRATGVDLSPVNIDHLRATGCDAVLGEGVEFLRRAGEPFAAIVAFQVIEHLLSGGLERLVELAFARLAPGGSLILESVNPHAPFALGNFWMDETHVAPVPPERLAFLAQFAGFEDVRIVFSAPVPGFALAGPDPRSHYCDYAVVARRPGLSREVPA